MLVKIISITKNVLLTTIRDRSNLVWLIVMPMVWTVLVGSISGAGSSTSTPAIPVAIINYDEGSYGTKFEEFLKEENGIEIVTVDSESELRSLVKETEIVGGLIIPKDFTDSLLIGTPAQIELIKSERSYSYFVNELVIRIARRISIDAQASNFALRKLELLKGIPEGDSFDYWEKAFEISDSSFEPEPSVRVNYRVLSVQDQEEVLVTGMELSSPGFAVLFVMMGVFFAGAAMVLERQQGTLSRLLTIPTARFTVVIGKMSGFFVLGLVQFVILILFGQILLGVNWGRSPFAILLIVISFTLSVTGIGTLLAVLVHTSAQAGAFGVLFSIVTSMLGGSWWPVEVMPSFMQNIAHFTPQFWALNGFTKVITRGFGVSSILPNFGILIGIAIISLLLAGMLFKFE